MSHPGMLGDVGCLEGLRGSGRTRARAAVHTSYGSYVCGVSSASRYPCELTLVTRSEKDSHSEKGSARTQTDEQTQGLAHIARCQVKAVNLMMVLWSMFHHREGDGQKICRKERNPQALEKKGKRNEGTERRDGAENVPPKHTHTNTSRTPGKNKNKNKKKEQKKKPGTHIATRNKDASSMTENVREKHFKDDKSCTPISSCDEIDR